MATREQLQAELARLRRELTRAEMERDIVQKSRRVLCERVAARYAFMKQLISDNNYPVRRVCGDAQPLRGFLVSEPLLDQAAAPPAVVKSMHEDRQAVTATLRRPWRKRPTYPS